MGVAGITFGQGSLTPPGAPGATMKTLNQVEPRTPISSLPYTITNSGSYYVTASLTTTGHGVVIETSGVTLDLMGFTISGDRGSSDYGVFLDGATNSTIQNVVVRNGIVRNFGLGVRAEYIQDSRFEFLISAANLYNGVNFSSSQGLCNGNSITDCTISGNGSIGVYLPGGSGQCNGNTIADCTISGNGSYGIYFNGEYGQCDGNNIVDCTVSANGNYGIHLRGNSGHCNGNKVANCMISGNDSYGICLAGYVGACEGNTIVDCTIRKNTGRGIDLSYVAGNRVEGNHITGQTGTSFTWGISCTSTERNLIVRNTCKGHTTNFAIDSDDTYGPIITTSGPLSDTNPWANFSR
jgi:parallel beta-helix repeat protein